MKKCNLLSLGLRNKFAFLLAKLFGKKTIHIDQAKADQDCSVKSTVYFYKDNYFLTDVEFIENKGEMTNV